MRSSRYSLVPSARKAQSKALLKHVLSAFLQCGKLKEGLREKDYNAGLLRNDAQAAISIRLTSDRFTMTITGNPGIRSRALHS